MPKVSVIIPVYNTEKYLRKCLDSVCSQTLSDIEIICINDCSTDNSLGILKEYSSKDKRIKIISFEENKGAAAARNIGIDDAQGEYISFIDSDDFIDSDFYEKLYSKATETNADIVKSNLIFKNRFGYYDDTEYSNIAVVKANKLLFNHVPTAIYRKSFLTDKNIYFPSELECAEDCVFEVKASFYANKISISDNTSYYYCFNEDSLNNSKVYTEEKLKSLVKSFSLIVDFLNSVDISAQDYISVIKKRCNGTIDNLYAKNNCSVNYDFCSEMEDVISKIKYSFDLGMKFDLLKKMQGRNKVSGKNNTGKIPKRVFYVWFGDKKTTLANICIMNWKDKLPDYEIIEINENSPYFDFQYEYENCRWFKDMYDRKLWAFVSDYARIKVLHDYGGIYLDTDVTLVKSLTPLLENSFFIGEQGNLKIGVGIFGTVKEHPILKDILDFYRNDIYDDEKYMIPDIVTYFYIKNHYDDIALYSKEYFYPFYSKEIFTENCIKENTYAIHWWNASWVDEKIKLFLKNKKRIATLRSRIKEKVSAEIF